MTSTRMCVWLCHSWQTPKSITVRVASRSVYKPVTTAMQSQVNKRLWSNRQARGQNEDPARKRDGKTEPARCCTPDLPREDISTSTWVDGVGELPALLLPQASQRSSICTQVWTAWLWSENWSSGKARMKFQEGKAKNLRRETDLERERKTQRYKIITCKTQTNLPSARGSEMALDFIVTFWTCSSSAVHVPQL